LDQPEQLIGVYSQRRNILILLVFFASSRARNLVQNTD